MKNTSPSLFLDNIGKQRRTPKNEQNVLMEQNRPEFADYVHPLKNLNGAFFTQRDMRRLRFVESVLNSMCKRGVADLKLSPLHAR